MCGKENTRMANGRSRVIEETTELGIGMLIAESEDGTYEPVAPVSTIREARDAENAAGALDAIVPILKDSAFGDLLANPTASSQRKISAELPKHFRRILSPRIFPP